LIWKILHERIRNEEHGPSVSESSKKMRGCKDDPAAAPSGLSRRTREGPIA
jgi:hypothetical protein